MKMRRLKTHSLSKDANREREDQLLSKMREKLLAQAVEDDAIALRASPESAFPDLPSPRGVLPKYRAEKEDTVTSTSPVAKKNPAATKTTSPLVAKSPVAT